MFSANEYARDYTGSREVGQRSRRLVCTQGCQAISRPFDSAARILSGTQ